MQDTRRGVKATFPSAVISHALLNNLERLDDTHDYVTSELVLMVSLYNPLFQIAVLSIMSSSSQITEKLLFHRVCLIQR